MTVSGSAPYLESKSKLIGQGVTFGGNVNIVAENIIIGDNVVIRDDVIIKCRGTLKIGDHSILGNGARIQCNNLTVGEWLFACDGLEIGSGGCNSKESNVTIGNRVGIFERVLINPNSEVKIGDNCGIGREVQIWTHGAWLDPLAGFPSDFGPVTIGNNVWLPARCIILPNASIGDNCVIGINSIINKPIPPGSLAAGTPVRVIKENAFPRSVSDDEATRIIQRVVDDWEVQIRYKLPDLVYHVGVEGSVVQLVVGEDETTFDCSTKNLSGSTNAISEDLRDYLRRRGIKIYTDDFFKSV